MAANNQISIEVAYALPERQAIITLDVKTGTTIETAILKSGILDQFPEINLHKQSVGIFNKLQSLTTVLQDGDRVVIYRELTIHPMQARRLKANSRRQLKQRVGGTHGQR